MEGFLRSGLDTFVIRDCWYEESNETAEHFQSRTVATRFLRGLAREPSNLRTLSAALNRDAALGQDSLDATAVIDRCAARLASGSWQMVAMPDLPPVPRKRPGLNFEVWGVDVNLNISKKGAEATFEGDRATTELKIGKRGPQLKVANSDGDKQIDANMKGLTLTRQDEDGTTKTIKLDKGGNLTLGKKDEDSGRQIKAGKDGFSLNEQDGDSSRGVSINKNGLSLSKKDGDESSGLTVGKNGVSLSNSDGDSRHHVGISKDGKVSGGVHLGDEDKGIGLSTDANGGVKASGTVGGITVGHSQDANGGHTTIGNGKHNIEVQKVDDFVEALGDGTIGDAFEDIGDGDFGGAKDKIVSIWDEKPFGKGSNQAA